MPRATTPSGQTVAFADHGGDGPALVLLHSFAMDGSMFAPQVAAFGDSHRCICIDLRGHGDTPADGSFDYWDVAADVVAVLDHLGVERAALAGTSQGGFVALRVALTAPERVLGLALLGTSAGAEEPEVVERYRSLAAAWVANGPVDELVDTVAAICLGEHPADGWKEKWRAVEPERFAANVETLVTRDGVLGRLGEVTVPALVMHGTADAAYPVAFAEATADGLPNAGPAVLVENGAHFLSLTDAGAVNGELAAFLGSLSDA